LHNNDIVARLRQTFALNNEQLAEMVALAGGNLDHAAMGARQCKPDSDGYAACSDAELAMLLDGLVIRERGPREDATPVDYSAVTLGNNAVLKKLRVALNYREPEMLATFEAGGVSLSARELGAFFRREDNKHFRPCPDALLKQFFKGLAAQRAG
jgi:uncharacterized protein YehS (DUF1456 family)